VGLTEAQEKFFSFYDPAAAANLEQGILLFFFF